MANCLPQSVYHHLYAIPRIHNDHCTCTIDNDEVGAFNYQTRWILKCRCGEIPDAAFDWTWQEPDESINPTVHMMENCKVVVFHSEYSRGTAIVRGRVPLTEGLHYWEMKMLSPAYGTDIMVGVGRPSMDLTEHHVSFISALGLNENSWGLSYRGQVQHGAVWTKYCPGFSRGTIVGCLLDLWHGTLSFYMNRRPLGVAFRGLVGGEFYPMISSTAARSGLRLIQAKSYPMTLQILACRTIREAIATNLSLVELVNFPPGLQSFLVNNLPWLMFRSENPFTQPHPKQQQPQRDQEQTPDVFLLLAPMIRRRGQEVSTEHQQGTRDEDSNTAIAEGPGDYWRTRGPLTFPVSEYEFYRERRTVSRLEEPSSSSGRPRPRADLPGHSSSSTSAPPQERNQDPEQEEGVLPKRSRLSED